jgi:lipopolysaccharide transport system permease protein
MVMPLKNLAAVPPEIRVRAEGGLLPADEDPRRPSGTAQRVVEIRPARGLLDLDLAELWRHRELLYFLVWREMKIRYRQALLGIGWAVIQPVFAVAIFAVIFGRFAGIPSDGVPYALFAFAAILPWTYFAEAVRRGATGLVGDAELIRKIYFPRIVITLAMVTAPLIDFLLSFLVLVALLAWHGIVPTWGILALPLFLAQALLLALAVGLWLGPINVRFRDVAHTLPFLIQIWMYASPIIYPVGMVPENWRHLYSLNPMVGVIEGFRWALLGKSDPDFLAMGIGACLVVPMLVGGLVFFRHMERSFADTI